MAKTTDHFWKTGRIVIAVILFLIVALIVALAFEPLIRLGMFLGWVAPQLPAK